MTNQWIQYKLGDVVNFISGGTPSKKNPDNWDGDFPWISCKDMKSNYLYDSQDHLTQLGVSKGTKVIPKNTILIVVRGMVLAKEFPVALSKREMAFNQDLKAIQCINSVINYNFLFWWFRGKSDEILGIADEAAHGTKRLQTDRLQNLRLDLPPLSTQRKIAGILSAYDDLIENNTRRIEILEEMARMLYREWFVKFRFPVNDGGEGGGDKGGDRPSNNHPVELVESELGLIPKGWEVKKLGDVVELAYGKSLTAKNRLPGDVPVFSSAGLIDYHNQSMVKAPGIVVGRKGNVGSVFWANKDFFPIDTTFYVQTDLPLHYVFYNLQNQNFVNNDAAVPGLNRNQAYSLDILIPESQLLQQFSKVINDFFQKIENLNQKNINLSKTRDLLLPRLISGEINVEDLDINIGTAIEP